MEGTTMILVRMVFQAKFGKGGELAAGMAKSMRGGMEGRTAGIRILTDLSGDFDTVVFEGVHESLAAWEKFRTELFSSAEFRDDSDRGQDLIVGGRQEYYTIEDEF
jgi:hypothetical protein